MYDDKIQREWYTFAHKRMKHEISYYFKILQTLNLLLLTIWNAQVVTAGIFRAMAKVIYDKPAIEFASGC